MYQQSILPQTCDEIGLNSKFGPLKRVKYQVTEYGAHLY